MLAAQLRTEFDRYCNFFLKAIKKHHIENNTTAQEVEAKPILQIVITLLNSEAI